MVTVFVILFCILCNAVLAGVEMAFVSVDRNLLKQRVKEGDERARRLLRLKEKPEKTLSAIQVGITLLASLTAAVGGTSAGVSVVPYLQESVGFSLFSAELIAIILVVLPITYFTVVVGEITPKALAIRHPYFFALFGMPLLRGLSLFLFPFVKICEVSTKALLRLISPEKIRNLDREKQYEEYQRVLEQYVDLPRKGKEYMANLGDIQKKTLADILLEWDQVDFVSYDQTLEELEEKIIETGHTRMPVVLEGKVVGVINTKEILPLSKGAEGDWRTKIHEPLRFLESGSPLPALNALQGRRVHMGIVEDLQGRPVGIVTMEDIIEEVLGEIYDEDDELV